MNLETGRQALSESLQASFQTFLHGARDDVRAFADRLALNLTNALALRREDLADEVVEQAQALGESLRLSGTASTWRAIQHALRAAFGFGMGLGDGDVAQEPIKDEEPEPLEDEPGDHAEELEA